MIHRYDGFGFVSVGRFARNATAAAVRELDERAVVAAVEDYARAWLGLKRARRVARRAVVMRRARASAWRRMVFG